MGKKIKMRLLGLDKRQVDLLDVLRGRGFPNLDKFHLSSIINGHTSATSPLAVAVLKKIDEILCEWEEERDKE